MRGDGEPIVVIDDDYAIRFSCGKILAKDGFHVEGFEDGGQGLEAVARLKPGVVLVDLKMPGLSGVEVIHRIHDIDPQIIMVVITGYATIDTAVEAMKSGAYDFLPKPFSPDQLRLIVNRALERHQLMVESHRSEMEREILKRRFVTFVSHQLQTPLVAIHQYLDVLKHLGDTEEAVAKRQDWLDRCLKRTEELRAIIKSWLTLASMEGGLLSRQRVKVDLKPVVLGILKTYEEMAATDGISLQTHFPEEPCLVRGDRNCLTVLFDNLIVNAIKYNKPDGKVIVSARPADGEIEISVSDTGVGIPEKYRQLLFGEFVRVKGGGAKRTSGTGLGLAICKKIVTESGGTITVVSEVNAGSTFLVRLPHFHEHREEPEAEEANSNGIETCQHSHRGR
jgi:signal transduction histidine kinase